jgi:hypothetical protein
MPFEIRTMTEARVASVTNRVEKHGDDEAPAVSIGLEIVAANTLLDIIDPNLRPSLYKQVEGQDDLPGVEAATPVLRCHSFETHSLTTAHEGWTMAVDDGIDDTQPMLFGGCKVDKFRVDAKQGGSIELRFRVSTSDVDADKLGKLAMHNGQSIWITLTAPAKGSGAIDGTTAAFERDHPAGEGDATDLFAQTHSAGGAGPDEEAQEAAPEAESDAEPSRGPLWPFPQDGGASQFRAQAEPPPDDVTIEVEPPKRGRRRRQGAAA